MSYYQSSAARSSRSSNRYSPYSRSPTPTSGGPSPLPSGQHLPDAENHTPQHALSSASDGQRQHPSIHSVTLGGNNYLSPASAYYPATTTPMTRQPAVPLLPYSSPIHAIPPSTSNQAYSHVLPSDSHSANHLSTNDVPPASVYSHSPTSNALLHPATSAMTEYPPAPLLSDFRDNYTTQPYASVRQLESSSYQLNQWLQPVPLSQPPFPLVPLAATNSAYPDRAISFPVDSLPGSQSLHAAQPSIRLMAGLL